MRPIDADSLIKLVNDTTVLSKRFKQVFVAIVNGEPTIEPERPTEPQVIHCGDCKNFVDGFFCCEANHHVSEFSCCQSVFGAERRDDEAVQNHS